MRKFIPCLAVALAVIVWAGHTPWLRVYMAVMGVKYQHLQTPHFRIGVYDSGESQLPPLVLVHGFLVDASLNWFTLVHRLSGHYRLVIPDLLNANPQKVLDPSYSMNNEVLLLRELIEGLHLEKPEMVFFSMSCIISSSFTSEGRITLIAPPPCKVEMYSSAMRALFDHDAAWFSKSLFYEAPPGYTLFSTLMHWKWKAHFPELLRIIEQQRLWSAPFAFSPPDALLLPEMDIFFPSSVADARACFPTATIQLLNKSGHAATWDAAETIADYLLEMR